MKYNRSLICIIVIILIALFSPIVFADPAIMITDYELVPEIFMPGDSGILTLTIKNAETTATSTRATTSTSGSYSSTSTTVETNGVTISNIWISHASDGTYKVKAIQNYANLGHISAGASFSISFEIIAEKNISEDLYFPKVYVDVEDDDYQDLHYPIPVRVSSATVDLISTNVPSKISKSGSTQITFTAVNKRESSVNNVIVTPKNIEGIEFTPESVFIGTMDSDSSEDVSFSLKPTEVGVKNLSFNISFKNGNNIHSSSITETIEVIDTLDVGSVFTSIPRSITKGGSSRITLEVYNAKSESITGVMVTPISDTTILPSQYFIGSMDPDDVFSASFDIFTDNLDLGDNTIEFEVSFKQGNEYYKTPTISTSFSVVSGEGSNFQSSKGTSEEMQAQPIGDILVICIPVIVGIIVIIAVVILLKWKKRRNVT